MRIAAFLHSLGITGKKKGSWNTLRTAIYFHPWGERKKRVFVGKGGEQ